MSLLLSGFKGLERLWLGFLIKLKKVKSAGLEMDMITYFHITTGQGLNPNTNRERLMDPWIA